MKFKHGLRIIISPILLLEKPTWKKFGSFFCHLVFHFWVFTLEKWKCIFTKMSVYKCTCSSTDLVSPETETAHIPLWVSTLTNFYTAIQLNITQQFKRNKVLICAAAWMYFEFFVLKSKSVPKDYIIYGSAYIFWKSVTKKIKINSKKSVVTMAWE